MLFRRLLPLCLIIASCSTVKNLPEGELLYLGTRKVAVSDSSYSPLRDKAIGEAKTAFVSPPNNALFGSSRFRLPLPIGLWAYNAFVGDSTRLGRWMFDIFASQPILVSTVNPPFRVEAARNTLRNFGYFDNRVTYHIDTLRNPRKAFLSYAIRLGNPLYYSDVSYRKFAPPMDTLIHQTWDHRLIRPKEQLSYASLSGERNRLFTLFRKHGYYFFSPDMIQILADTTLHPGKASIRIEGSFLPHPDMSKADRAMMFIVCFIANILGIIFCYITCHPDDRREEGSRIHKDGCSRDSSLRSE